MHIQAITLNTHALEALYRFYVEDWQLPVLANRDDRFTVGVGLSELTFVRNTTREWHYHFAFNIAPNLLDVALPWVQARADVLVNAQSVVIHDASPTWDARMFYYRDTAGNIGELIARNRLPMASNQSFDETNLLSVSEIGVAVPHVPPTVAQCVALGLPRFGEGSDTFTAVGDDHGLLIVVKQGRLWFPLQDTGADCVPVSVTIKHQHRTDTFLEESWANF